MVRVHERQDVRCGLPGGALPFGRRRDAAVPVSAQVCKPAPTASLPSRYHLLGILGLSTRSYARHPSDLTCKHDRLDRISATESTPAMTAASILEHPRHCLDIVATVEVSASQVDVQECVWIDVARTPGGAAAAGGQEASRQLPRQLPPQHPASSSGRARPVLQAPKGPARHGPPARHTRRLSCFQALPKE